MGPTPRTVDQVIPLNTENCAILLGSRLLLIDESYALTFNGLEAVPAEIAGSNSDVVIGAYPDTMRGGFSLTKKFSGEIDDVLVYTRALSEQEIAELYADMDFSTAVVYDPIPTVQEVTLEHDSIEIGEPVVWTQQVTLSNETQSVAIELPADAQILEVEATVNDTSITIVYNADSLAYTDDENVVVPVAELTQVSELIENYTDTKLLVINETATEYTVTFETDAPYTIEEEQSTNDMYNKTVIVAHNSTLHYTDVKSYSDIPEDLVAQGVEFSLFWNINGTKTDVTYDSRFQVEYVDTDGNGIADQMQWIVPQLSQQQFEIIAAIGMPTKSLSLYQSKYGAFSPKIATKILDVITDIDPILAAQRAGISYDENKIQVHIYLDDSNSLANIPPNIIISAAEGRIAAAKLSIDEMNQLSLLDSVIRIGIPQKRVLLNHDVSEGVSFTLADNFHNAGIDGSGVTIAVIDGGFVPSDSEIASNVISSTLFDNGNNCGGSINCGDAVGDSHGTAVAEIIVDMASGVNLRLYTIWDVTGGLLTSTVTSAASKCPKLFEIK